MPHPLTEILISHRASGTLIADLPASAVPQTADEAYQVQFETVTSLGPIGAWKVQPIPESGQPVASPLLANTIFSDGVTLRAADFPDTGIEVEVAVIINRHFPATPQGYVAADMRDAIDSIHIALEILSSRFVDRRKMPPLATTADLQSASGIVLGAAVPAKDLPEFGQQAMSLSFDGVEAQTTSGNATTDNLLSSLAWLANHAAARGLALKPGDVVITGSRLGPLTPTGQKVLANAPGLGSVSASFV